jgi:diguanylate cyclase (GGDEF)-like protein
MWMGEERHFSTRGTWLVADEAGRGRMLDMDQRLSPVRRASLVVLGLALVASGPWFGWWPLLPLAVAAVAFGVAERWNNRSPTPEYGIFAAWVLTQVTIAAAVALSEGPVGVAMAWMALPVVTLSARFSLQGVAWGVAITLGLMIAVSFGVHAERIVNDPPLLIMPAALVIGLGMLSTALMRSDMEHRSEALVDPLTGMLNRKALAARIAELTQQSRVSGEPIGVIIGDVDRFKAINDEHGHSTGDAVLRDAAYVLRKQLRAFDLVYRLGGEEFLVLLPGSDVEQAHRNAERLRVAVADASVVAGVQLTMSFGVSASKRGSEFDYDEVFAVADAALYEAKRGGRDQVVSGAKEAALVP